MKVRVGCAPAVAHGPDLLTRFNLLPNLYEHLEQVRVAGAAPIRVAYEHHAPIPDVPLRHLHHSGARRQHRLTAAFTFRHVNPFMKLAISRSARPEI
jgi:hypothetical protein